MRSYDVKCEAESDLDGTIKLSITVTGLNMDQAKAIAERMQAPFRIIVNDVLTEGGTIEAHHRDMLRKTQ